ncbi:hypothetical protein C8F01DRAFT_790574, partial [Mycena amicta]
SSCHHLPCSSASRVAPTTSTREGLRLARHGGWNVDGEGLTFADGRLSATALLKLRLIPGTQRKRFGYPLSENERYDAALLNPRVRAKQSRQVLPCKSLSLTSRTNKQHDGVRRYYKNAPVLFPFHPPPSTCRVVPVPAHRAPSHLSSRHSLSIALNVSKACTLTSRPVSGLISFAMSTPILDGRAALGSRWRMDLGGRVSQPRYVCPACTAIETCLHPLPTPLQSLPMHTALA